MLLVPACLLVPVCKSFGHNKFQLSSTLSIPLDILMWAIHLPFMNLFYAQFKAHIGMEAGQKMEELSIPCRKSCFTFLNINVSEPHLIRPVLNIPDKPSGS